MDAHMHERKRVGGRGGGGETTWQARTPVAEAKELLLLVLDALQEGGDVLHATDALQHAQDRLVRAAMERPVQRSHGSRNRGVHIHPRACQVARCRGGAVHLVLSVEDEHDVDRPRKPWVRAVVCL